MAKTITVKIENIEMRCGIFGTGSESLVIIPGVSVSHVTDVTDAVEGMLKKFCGKYTIYLLDRNENIKEGATVEDMAEDSYLVLRSLGVEKADFYGTSQGGMVSLAMSVLHPEMVGRMVLVSTAALPTSKLKSICSDWKRFIDANDQRALSESFVDRMFSKNYREKYRDAYLSSVPEYTKEDLNRFKVQVEACETVDLFHKLDRVHCPVLIMGSMGDTVVGIEASLAIAYKLKCETHIYSDKYEHAVYDEVPDCREKLYDFLSIEEV